MRYDTKRRAVDWVTGFQGLLIDTGTAIDVAENGDVVIGVSLQYDLAIDPQTQFDSNGDYFDGGLVLFDDNGTVVWSMELGVDDNSEEVIGVAIDEKRNVYATGVFEDEIIFDSFTLENSSTRAHDTWVAKIANGQTAWAYGFGDDGFDQPTGLALGPDALYVTGRFDDTIEFGTERLDAMGGYDIFVASFVPDDGAVRWARSFGGVADDQPSGIVRDFGRGVYFSGYATGDFMFNDEMQTAAGGGVDGFVIRLEEADPE